MSLQNKIVLHVKKSIKSITILRQNENLNMTSLNMSEYQESISN